jgi:DNA-binding LacI/PurR family transcriptional regulator
VCFNAQARVDGREKELARRDVTIRDVAALSGVSIATVTRTFQESSLVRPETSERVRRAAQQLGYRPNSVARALVTGMSNTIGILIPSLVEAYWGEVADGIERGAGDRGLSVVIASTRGDPERARVMFDILMGKRVDGMIVAGFADLLDTRTEADQRDAPPVVLLDADDSPHPELLDESRDGSIVEAVRELGRKRRRGDWLAEVAYDDVAGARLLAHHLLKLGHTTISFVAGPPLRSCLNRLIGVRSAVEEAGFKVYSVNSAPHTFEGGYAAARELLSASSRPTGIVCYSDEMAIGVIRAAHELRLDVPDDVSVVGYDDIAVSAFVDPPLTTLRNPKRELGELALELLLRGIAGEEVIPREARLIGSLVPRESAGPPSPSPG